MPDNVKNFTVDATNAPISESTVTRAELINALEHLNYVAGQYIKAIDELTGPGIVSIGAAGVANARLIGASSGLTVANGDGSSGNPTISLGTPHTFRKGLLNTEADTVTADVAVSIISNAGTYSLPQPTVSVISDKVIINNSSGDATITSSYWGDTSISTSVVIPTKQMAIFFTDLAQKWYVQVSANLTIS